MPNNEELIAPPVRVQLSRKKGWRMPPNTVSVARPGRWGNPYSVALLGLDVAIAMFRNTASGYWTGAPANHLDDDLFEGVYRAHVRWGNRVEELGYRHPQHAVRGELRGKNLACWCPLDQPCHADVLLELANPAIARARAAA